MTEAAIPARWQSDATEESTSDDLKREVVDQEIAQRVGMCLYKHYPRHHWHVGVDGEAGVVTIRTPLLPKDRGYQIPFRSLTAHAIKIAGGELLERFLLPRGAFDRDKWRDASKKHHRTALGIFPHEVNLETGRVRKILPGEIS